MYPRGRSVRTGMVVFGLLWLAAALVGVFFAVHLINAKPDYGSVGCGGQTMRSGDVCQSISDSQGDVSQASRDPREQAENNAMDEHRMGWELLVLAGVLGGAGVFGAAKESLR